MTGDVSPVAMFKFKIKKTGVAGDSLRRLVAFNENPFSLLLSNIIKKTKGRNSPRRPVVLNEKSYFLSCFLCLRIQCG